MMLRIRAGLLLLGFWAAGALPAGAAAQSDHSGTDARTALLERALESRTRGPDSAAVVVFEIADFQCPYCAQFATTVGPQVAQKYVRSGKVQWVFVNMPLHSHPLAWSAAEAALCAGAAGGDFWAMHDRLYSQQSTWTTLPDPSDRFASMAEEAGASAQDYRTCVARDQVASLILQDLGSAISAGISGTPAFIVTHDRQVLDRMVGVQTMETWTDVLDLALQGKSAETVPPDSGGASSPGG